MLVTVRGTFLADLTRDAQPPLPNEIGGTTVRINGISVPFITHRRHRSISTFDLPGGRGTGGRSRLREIVSSQPGCRVIVAGYLYDKSRRSRRRAGPTPAWHIGHRRLTLKHWGDRNR